MFPWLWQVPPWLVMPWFSWVNLPFHFPLSGDVTQDIETEWNLPFSGPYVGERELERRILADVAGYGEQLGKVLDALAGVIEVIEAGGDKRTGDQDVVTAFSKLKDMHGRIEEAKKRYRVSTARHALRALERLDPEAYDRLVSEITESRKGRGMGNQRGV
jgi:hypothetical protein